MNNGSFHQSPAANHLLQLQYLPPAIAFGPAPEAGTRNGEGKHLIPAILYRSEPEQGAQAAKTLPEREVIPVDGKEAEIMQMAESIEREGSHHGAIQRDYPNHERGLLRLSSQ